MRISDIHYFIALHLQLLIESAEPLLQEVVTNEKGI